MLYIICFNIEKLSSEIYEIINNDYSMIRQYILEKKVSQKRAKMLTYTSTWGRAW